MGLGALCVLFINASGCDEALESPFIDPLVGVDAALEAFEIASGLSKVMV